MTGVTMIGPYTVVRELGSGGMGRVYLATSPSGRAVAVKVVRPELAADPGFRQRFRTEVHAARAVSGAFTAPVVDADPDGPMPWLATAYVTGPSLQAAVNEHGPFPEPSLRMLGAGLAEALVAIHRAGLIHRDLKPSNILLAADGPRVIDFGISEPTGGLERTADEEIIGSPGFMSPEHVAGRPLTPTSDVFSLGAVLVFAATGEPPFGTGSFHAVTFRAAHQPPSLAGVPPALAGLLAACLDKDPARRPPPESLPALFQAAPVTTGWLPYPLQPEPQPGTTRRGPSRRTLLIGGGALAATAAAGAGGWLLRPGPPPPVTPRLQWSTYLPEPGLQPLMGYRNTMICGAKQTGMAAFDTARGTVVWNDFSASDQRILGSGPRVYAYRSDGRMHAFDTQTGHELWAAAPPGKPDQYIDFTVNDSTLVVMENGNLHGVNAATGALAWNSPIRELQIQIVGTIGDIVVTTDAGIVDSGLPTYNGTDINTGALRWTRMARTLVVPDDGTMVFAVDADMNLVALNSRNGNQYWSTPSGFPQKATELYANLTLYTGQNVAVYSYGTTLLQPGGNNIGVFDLSTGRKIWSKRTALTLGRPMAHWVLGYFDTAFHAVDVRTGRPLWSANAHRFGKLTYVGVADALFLAGSASATGGHGEFYGWDSRNGRLSWRLAVPATAGTGKWAINRTSTTTFALCYSDRLYSFRMPEVSWTA